MYAPFKQRVVLIRNNYFVKLEKPVNSEKIDDATTLAKPSVSSARPTSPSLLPFKSTQIVPVDDVTAGSSTSLRSSKGETDTLLYAVEPDLVVTEMLAFPSNSSRNQDDGDLTMYEENSYMFAGSFFL